MAAGGAGEGPDAAVPGVADPRRAHSLARSRAEHEVFERFAEMSQGPVTLLVSHRFSTVRMADQIVVLHGGRVEEVGTHDELLAAGGRYATLFRLQASRY